MKKITEKDLSLDKQVVSNLSGDTDTRAETDGIRNDTENTMCECLSNYENCATQNCTKSMYEICCDETYKACNPILTKLDTCMCPVTNDSICDVCSVDENCMTTPVETKDNC